MDLLRIGAQSPVGIGEHVLPPLPYDYTALSPIIDAEALKIHHNILHQGYVDGLNKAEKYLEAAREEMNFDVIKYWENELAYNGSGHILHSLYWTIMQPVKKKPQTPGPHTLKAIQQYFGSYMAFEAQFKEAARTVEGSGWCILGYNPSFRHLEILQVGKHQNLTQWGILPILTVDVWEHAYYLQYQNRRADYIKDWFQIINWEEVERRLHLARRAKLPLTMK